MLCLSIYWSDWAGAVKKADKSTGLNEEEVFSGIIPRGFYIFKHKGLAYAQFIIPYCIVVQCFSIVDLNRVDAGTQVFQESTQKGSPHQFDFLFSLLKTPNAVVLIYSPTLLF